VSNFVVVSIFMSDNDVNVVYDGTKEFEDGSKFFVTIVEHKLCACIEIIIFNPDLPRNAQRIYLNAHVVHSKASQVEMKEELSSLKIKLIEEYKITKTEELEHKVLWYMLSQYILSRLTVLINVPFPGAIKVSINNDYTYKMKTDLVPVVNNITIELTCSRPVALHPYSNPYASYEDKELRFLNFKALDFNYLFKEL
jgi:hypothetical protein